MTPRLILLTTIAALLAGCDQNASAPDAQRTGELERQRQAEQVANDKIRQLEQRLDDTEKQKSAERETELARVKEELEQVKRDKEVAAQRAREIENETTSAEPVGEAPRGEAVRADLRHIVDEDDADDSDPVYAGRVVPETQRVADVDSFYEPLDPYGDWIETDDYGYVFRPAAAARGGNWRPYTDGRWIHTDYGWTWESNEDFGWATYHYGRWARVGGTGWVWVPGKEWGPGWVSWRRGDDYCGWAPLPPETRTRGSFTATVDRDFGIGPAAYIFVALTNFGARSYAPVIERPERNVTIINKTVNITNITYNTTNNRTVVYNGGPRYDVIRAKSQQPVEQVKVNFAPRNTTVNNTKIVNVVQGNNLRVAAPPMPPANREAAPRRVTQKLAKPVIDKGWDGVDAAQAQKVKQEMVETSVPRRNRVARPAGPAAARPVAKPEDAKPEPPKPAVVNPEPPKPAAPKPPTPQRPAVAEKPPRPDADPVKPAAPKPPAPRRPVVDEAPAKPAAEPPPKREPRPAPPAPVESKPVPSVPAEPKSVESNPTPPPPARKPPVAAPSVPDIEPAARATPAPRPPRLDRGPRPVPGAGDDQPAAPAARPRPPVEPAVQRPPAVPANPPAAVPKPVRPPVNPEAAEPKPVRQSPANVNRPPAPDAPRRNPEAPQRPPAATVQRPAAPAAQATPTPEEIAKKRKERRDPNGAR